MTESFTAALSYDDGPAVWTPGILALLAAYSAKATFFVCGQNVVAANDRDLMRQIAYDHEMGNHGFTHTRFSEMSADRVRSELAMTNSLILEATGQTPTLYRAPHFDVGDSEPIAAALELRHVGCTIDPADWAGTDATAIARHVLDRLEPGAIVDLHDGIPPGGGNGTASRAPTVEATRIILELTPHVIWTTVSDL